MAYYEGLLLLLIILSSPSSPPFYSKVICAIVSLKLCAPWIPFLSCSLFLTGHLSSVWICFQPNVFPFHKFLPISYTVIKYSCILWIIRGVIFCKGTSLFSSSFFVTLFEGSLLTIGLVWRLYVIVLQIRATPPVAIATPILSALVPLFHYSKKEFYNSDGSSDEIVDRREQSMKKLSSRWGVIGKRNNADIPSSADANKETELNIDRLADVRKYLADTRFTSTFKTFFPFQKYATSQLDPSFILDRVTDDNYLIDQDGTKLWDCDCSFGVNVLGYKHYKRFLKNGF